MRKSREDTAESRRRILKEASRLYREKGFDGVSVADIMQAAGMTHGGFYRHFPSKEALIAEAMAEAFADRTAPLTPQGDVSGTDLIRGYIEMYLSQSHLDRPGMGCPIASVGSEAGHVGGSVSEVFNTGIQRVVEGITAALGGPREDHRAKAVRLLATLVGAVVISRAVGTGSGLRAEVLDAVRKDTEIARLL